MFCSLHKSQWNYTKKPNVKAEHVFFFETAENPFSAFHFISKIVVNEKKSPRYETDTKEILVRIVFFLVHHHNCILFLSRANSKLSLISR